MIPLGKVPYRKQEARMALLKNLFKKSDKPKNPTLESAMHEVARNDNAKTREALYKAVLASTFIFQGNVSGEAGVRKGELIAGNDTRIAFRTIEYPPGKTVLPVFTDVEALSSWVGPDAQWVTLPAQQLFQSIIPCGIDEVRVNPFRPDQKISRAGGIITRNEFAALAQGLLPESMTSNMAQMKVAAGQKLLIGAPTQEPPAEFLEGIADYFHRIPEIRGAYLFEMTNQSVTSSVIGL